VSGSPYISAAPSVSTIMSKVLLALVPGISAYVWVYGSGILLTLALATSSAVIAEAAMLKLRQQPVQPFICDMSAVVTAWLLALLLPALTPWWLVIIAVFFAIVIAKQIFGGLGCNPFNPAMLGYAVLLITFPQLMNPWPTPLALMPLDFMDQLHVIFSSELVATGYFLGGLYLIQQRIISWHLPTVFLVALTLIATGFYVSNPAQFPHPLFNVVGGASVLCAFFIITDPVSGASSLRAKLYFAVGAGALTAIIGAYAGYAYGLACAVLLMNLCVPMIDKACMPRVFGHKP
jgi:electron transport complex protein RnfD